MSTLAKLLLVPAAVLVAVAGVALAGGASSAFEGGSSGIVSTDATTTDTLGTETGARVDISGPCDEAEHANDPRCTGEAPAGSSGPGPGREDDGDHDGRSGSSGPDNSGPGSLSSGHGDGEDGR